MWDAVEFLQQFKMAFVYGEAWLFADRQQFRQAGAFVVQTVRKYKAGRVPAVQKDQTEQLRNQSGQVCRQADRPIPAPPMRLRRKKAW